MSWSYGEQRLRGRNQEERRWDQENNDIIHELYIYEFATLNNPLRKVLVYT